VQSVLEALKKTVVTGDLIFPASISGLIGSRQLVLEFEDANCVDETSTGTCAGVDDDR